MPTGHIALMGGNEFRPDCEAMDRAILARIGGIPRVAIVPTAAARENPKLAAENGVRYFRGLGARAEPVLVVDSVTAGQSAPAARARSADLVYFTGGDPVYLLEAIRGSLFWQAVRNALYGGCVLAGSSAGAMVCGGMMWAPGAGWREGLGLLPRIAILPHHSTLRKKWNPRAMRPALPRSVLLVGIDEATALFGPPWEVIGAGEVVVYSGNKLSAFAEGEKIPEETGKKIGGLRSHGREGKTSPQCRKP